MKNKIEKGFGFDILLCVVLSMIFTMLGIVLFSLSMNFFDIPAKFIIPTNQTIKFLGIFLGVMIGVKNKNCGLIKGGTSGGVAMLCLFLLFSGLGGSIVFTKYIACDISCGVIVGIIAGVLAVNIKKDRKG